MLYTHKTKHTNTNIHCYHIVDFGWSFRILGRNFKRKALRCTCAARRFVWRDSRAFFIYAATQRRQDRNARDHSRQKHAWRDSVELNSSSLSAEQWSRWAAAQRRRSRQGRSPSRRVELLMLCCDGAQSLGPLLRFWWWWFFRQQVLLSLFSMRQHRSCEFKKKSVFALHLEIYIFKISASHSLCFSCTRSGRHLPRIWGGCPGRPIAARHWERCGWHAGAANAKEHQFARHISV